MTNISIYKISFENLILNYLIEKISEECTNEKITHL